MGLFNNNWFCRIGFTFLAIKTLIFNYCIAQNTGLALYKEQRNCISQVALLLKTNAVEAYSLLEKQGDILSDTILEVSLLKAQALDILEKNEEALTILKDLTDSTKNTTNRRVLLLARFETAKIIYYQGQYDSAFHLFSRLEKEFCPVVDSSQLGWVILFKGKTLRVMGQYQLSQDCYRQARDIANRFNDPALLATVLISTGKNHIVEGNLELALKDYLEAYRMSEPLSDYLIFGDVCNHLGGYYLIDNQPEKALEYHQKSLKYRLQLGAPDEIGQSYNNIGRVFMEQNRPDSAEFYFKQSINLFNQSHYLKGLIKGYSNLGKLYLAIKKTNEARTYLYMAHQLAIKSGYQSGQSETAIAIANYYLQQKVSDSSVFYFKQSLNLLQTSSDDDMLSDVYKGLYSAYKLKGDSNQALFYHEKLLESVTNRLNVENKRQLSSLLLDFDYERKEKDNRILKQENEVKNLTIKRNRLIIWFTTFGLLFFLVMSLLILGRLRYNERMNKQLTLLNEKIIFQNKELEVLNKNLQQAGQEKDKLFSIISHELRNPLFWFHNLSSMLSRNYKNMDGAKLERSLSSLNESAQNVYHLMDNLLFWSRSQLNRIVPRKSEFIVNDKIEDVFHTFKSIIESKEIEWETNVPDKLRIYADVDLLTSIIRNLLSNAIKYTPEKGKITLTVLPQPDFLLFSVSDTGIGFPPIIFKDAVSSLQSISVPGILNEKGSGLGLKLCKDFIEMHDGKIWVENPKDKGSIIHFTISQKRPQTIPSCKIS